MLWAAATTVSRLSNPFQIDTQGGWRHTSIPLFIFIPLGFPAREAIAAVPLSLQFTERK